MEVIVCLMLVEPYLGTYLEPAATTGSSICNQA